MHSEINIDCMGENRTMDPEKGISHKACVKDKAKIIEMGRKIYNAVIKGSLDVIVEDKDVLRKVTSTENTILHVAAKYGKVDVAKRIISERPSLLCETNKKGDTPLHIVASVGRLEMTKVLLECAKGIKVCKRLLRINNIEKDTVLHAAVRNGHHKIVEFLIEEDPGLTSLTNKVGEAPLFVAVDRRFGKIAMCILSKTPECSYEGRKGMNVLHAAAIRYKEIQDLHRSLGLLILI